MSKDAWEDTGSRDDTIEDMTDEERYFGWALRFGDGVAVALYRRGADPDDKTFHYHSYLPYDKQELRKLAEVLLIWRAGDAH